MTKEKIRELAEQAIRESHLTKRCQVSAVKRPPYESDPTWWIDVTDSNRHGIFQVLVTLAPKDTDESIKEKIKRQLQDG